MASPLPFYMPEFVVFLVCLSRGHGDKLTEPICRIIRMIGCVHFRAVCTVTHCSAYNVYVWYCLFEAEC